MPESNPKPEQKFECGSVVRLKSGGPAMTVSKFDDYYPTGWCYVCVWFDDVLVKQSDLFLETDLELIK